MSKSNEGSKQKGKGKGFNRDYKPKPDDSLFLDGSGSNWHVFETLYKERVSAKFGILVNELDADEDLAYIPEEPAGEHGSFEYRMALEVIKNKIKEYSELESARPRLFGDMLQHLSTLSDRKVRQHPFFETANAEMSPRILWSVIKETHIAPQHVGQIGVWIIRDKLTSCKQGQRSIEEYSRIFKQNYAQLVSMRDEAFNEGDSHSNVPRQP